MIILCYTLVMSIYITDYERHTYFGLLSSKLKIIRSTVLILDMTNKTNECTHTLTFIFRNLILQNKRHRIAFIFKESSA